MSFAARSNPTEAIRQHAKVGLLALACLLFGVGGWSALASIEGAVIAAGTVVVETSRKRVQHAEGGIVEKINVADGDYVEAGDVLIELDGARVRAEQQIIDARLFDAEIKQLRLQAEVDEQESFSLPPDLAARASERHEFATMIRVQESLQLARSATRQSQDGQIHEQIKRLKAEVIGLEQQHAGRQKELSLIHTEVDAVSALAKKGLALRQGLNNLLRQEANIDAEIGRLVTDMASARGQMKELSIKRDDLESQFVNDTLNKLEENSSLLSDLRAQHLANQDRLDRLSIRAPKTGLVHELSVRTVDAVIAPGDILLYVIPASDSLVIEANIRPMDIDQVRIGQDAQVRLSAFNMRTTPSLKAMVSSVSADQSVDPRTGEPHYKVRLVLEEEAAEKIDGNRITPGMPAEVLVTSEGRTVLSYLVQPLSDQINRAFREE